MKELFSNPETKGVEPTVLPFYNVAIIRTDSPQLLGLAAEEEFLFSRGKRTQRRHPITGGVTLARALVALSFIKDKKPCFSCWEVERGSVCCAGEGGWGGAVGSWPQGIVLLSVAFISCDVTREAGVQD